MNTPNKYPMNALLAALIVLSLLSACGPNLSKSIAVVHSSPPSKATIDPYFVGKRVYVAPVRSAESCDRDSGGPTLCFPDDAADAFRRALRQEAATAGLVVVSDAAQPFDLAFHADLLSRASKGELWWQLIVIASDGSYLFSRRNHRDMVAAFEPTADECLGHSVSTEFEFGGWVHVRKFDEGTDDNSVASVVINRALSCAPAALFLSSLDERFPLPNSSAPPGGWWRANAQAQEFHKEYYDCQKENPVTVREGMGRAEIRSKGDGVTAQGHEVQVTETNANPAMVNSCLEAKGWSWREGGFRPLAGP